MHVDDVKDEDEKDEDAPIKIEEEDDLGEEIHPTVDGLEVDPLLSPSEPTEEDEEDLLELDMDDYDDKDSF